MKKIQTANHAKTIIGRRERTVGLTSKPRTVKSRTSKKSIVASSKITTRRAAGARTGCSGCSRNKK